MLWTPSNTFHWSVDNFGSTYTDTGIGTSVTAHATTAHTKGTPVSLLAGASVTEDVYGIAIVFSGGSSSGAIRQFLCDILIDPNGGSSWSTLIANLLVNSPSLDAGGYQYYFPLYIKNGTSIGVQQQCSTANISMRVAVKLFGKPSRPELIRSGSKVQTYGVDTSTTSGSPYTLSSGGTLGNWLILGSADFDTWWWQVGIAFSDTNISDGGYWLDVGGILDSTIVCAEGIRVVQFNTEEMGKAAVGMKPPVRNIKAGESAFVRATSLTSSLDLSPSVAAYGLSD